MSARPSPGDRAAAARSVAIGVAFGVVLWGVVGAVAYVVYLATA